MSTEGNLLSACCVADPATTTTPAVPHTSLHPSHPRRQHHPDRQRPGRQLRCTLCTSVAAARLWEESTLRRPVSGSSTTTAPHSGPLPRSPFSQDALLTGVRTNSMSQWPTSRPTHPRLYPPQLIFAMSCQYAKCSRRNGRRPHARATSPYTPLTANCATNLTWPPTPASTGHPACRRPCRKQHGVLNILMGLETQHCSSLTSLSQPSMVITSGGPYMQARPLSQ